jgi:hypothetical protein
MNPENKSNWNVTETEEPKIKQSWIKRRGVRIAGAVLAASALLGGVAYVLDRSGIVDIPGIHQSKEISSIFDNNLDIQYIKAGVNAVPATESDLNSVDNVISPSNKQGYFDIDLVFPALLQAGDHVKVEKESFTLFPGFPEKTTTITSRYLLTIERAGTQLTSGVIDKDAKTIEVFKLPYVLKASALYFHGITIRVTRNDGTTYGIGYSSPEDIRNLKALPILDDAPILEWEEVQIGDFKVARYKNQDQLLGKFVDITTPLLETTVKNTVVEYVTGVDDITPSPNQRKVTIFDNASFLTDANGKLEYFPQPTKK